MRRTVLILFVLIGLPIVITAPVSAQGPDCAWQFGNCRTSVNSNCTAQCQGQCASDPNPAQCIATCVQQCSVGPLGDCVLSREGCVSSGGTDGGCDGLYSTCSQVSDSVGGACFNDYAQCQYATNTVDRSQWMSGEFDMTCVANVQAEFYYCLEGGNPGCVSQITGTVFGNCCTAHFREEYQSCKIY